MLHNFYRSYPQETVDYVNKCWKFIYSNASVKADIQVRENIKIYVLSHLMNIGTSQYPNTPIPGYMSKKNIIIQDN